MEPKAFGSSLELHPVCWSPRSGSLDCCPFVPLHLVRPLGCARSHSLRSYHRRHSNRLDHAWLSYCYGIRLSLAVIRRLWLVFSKVIFGVQMKLLAKPLTTIHILCVLSHSVGSFIDAQRSLSRRLWRCSVPLSEAMWESRVVFLRIIVLYSLLCFLLYLYMSMPILLSLCHGCSIDCCFVTRTLFSAKRHKKWILIDIKIKSSSSVGMRVCVFLLFALLAGCGKLAFHEGIFKIM